MVHRRKIEEKLIRREKRYEVEQRMKEKRSEEYEVLEEVFDKSTLMTIYHLMNNGTIKRLYGIMSAGKESRVYHGVDPKGQELAVKIYLMVSAEFRKGMLIYIQGDPRFKHVKHGTRSLIYAWALKEYKNLQRAYESGVRVPKPITVRNNVLVMEFIGEEGVPAPLMKDALLKHPEKIYRRLLEFVKTLYQEAKLVHGDLSEYNVMIWKDAPVIFDISQAVPLEHPMASQFLYRDLNNLNHFFEKWSIKIKPLEEAYEMVTKDG